MDFIGVTGGVASWRLPSSITGVDSERESCRWIIAEKVKETYLLAFNLDEVLRTSYIFEGSLRLVVELSGLEMLQARKGYLLGVYSPC